LIPKLGFTGFVFAISPPTPKAQMLFFAPSGPRPQRKESAVFFLLRKRKICGESPPLRFVGCNPAPPSLNSFFLRKIPLQYKQKNTSNFEASTHIFENIPQSKTNEVIFNNKQTDLGEFLLALAAGAASKPISYLV